MYNALARYSNNDISVLTSVMLTRTEVILVQKACLKTVKNVQFHVNIEGTII